MLVKVLEDYVNPEDVSHIVEGTKDGRPIIRIYYKTNGRNTFYLKSETITIDYIAELIYPKIQEGPYR